MRLLVDEHIGRAIIAHLQTRGHDVEAVVDVMQGETDGAVFLYAKKQDRIILTLDVDFGNILLFPSIDHAGILLLRLKNINPYAITALLDEVFSRLSQERIKGRIVVVSSKRVRIYPKS